MPNPTFDRTVVGWHADGMFDAAGGVMPLLHLLERHGFPVPQPDTAYMWRHRGRIPAAWVPTIVYVLLKEGKAKLSGLLRMVPPAGDGEEPMT